MTLTRGHQRRGQVLVLALILLAGFWLRAALHDYHGLEGDDGYSLSLARLDTSTLLEGLNRLELDIHPPLHFVALQGWIGLAGESLLSLRLMNILADVVIGALVMRAAGRLFSWRTAVMGGVLWLAAPLLISSTYLIRMYTLLALFSTAGAACVIEAHLSRKRRTLWEAGAAAAGLMAAGTHIVGALVAVVLALAVLVSWLIRRERRISALAPGLAAFAGAGLLYLPYASAVWTVYRSGRSLGADISEAHFTEPVSALFAITATLLSHRVLAGAAGLILTILLLAGSVWLVRRCAGRVLPPLAIFWLGVGGMAALAWLAGFYKTRYLVPFAPVLLILAAGMLALLRPAWRAAALVVVVGISGWGVIQDLDRSFRDDWTAAAAFIQQHERPGDKIIVIPDWGQTAFQYHYQRYGGEAPVVGLFPHVSEAVDYAGILQEQTEDAPRVWFVHYQPEVSDPDRLADQWFRAQAVTITEVFPAGMHVHYYDFQPQQQSLPTDARPLDARFGDLMRLHGVFLPIRRGSAQDQRLHPPSQWVQVILYWEALAESPQVVPRVRLTDPYAQVYGLALERENDLLRQVPAQTWQPGDIWQVAYDLNLNPQTPPGIYNIEVMVLDTTTGQPLPATGADAGEYWVVAGQFVVE